MTTIILCAVASILSVEIARRLGIGPRLLRFNRLLSKSMRVVRSPAISDHWKERVLPRYSAGIFKATLGLALVMILFLAPFALVIALGYGIGEDVDGFLSSLTGILVVTAMAGGYALVRQRIGR